MDVITFPENLLTTSGLSILLHDVISLPDAMSYDNLFYTIHLKGIIKQTNKNSFAMAAEIILFHGGCLEILQTTFPLELYCMYSSTTTSK